MKREVVKPTLVKCPSCDTATVFSQPYPYHAGFGNQGFLYNRTGNCTLIWSSFDPDYETIVGQKHPWALSEDDRIRLESALASSPDGTEWGFGHPARCAACGSVISESILHSIYYYVFDGSIDLDTDSRDRTVTLKNAMK